MSAFDPTTFMGEMTSEAGDPNFKPVPEGEYLASIGSDEKDVKPRSTKDGSVALDIFWYIEDPKLAEAMNMEKPRVKQGFFLDLDSAGKLAWGTNQNTRLAAVREALGQNKAGQPWSPRKLLGSGPALIKTVIRPHPTDTDHPGFAEVTLVSPASTRSRRAA